MLNWRKEPEGGLPSLPQVLIEEGLASEPQVEEGLQKAERDSTFLGQALVEMGVIKQNDLITCLVKKCKIPHLSLLDYDIGEDLVNLVSKENCHRYHLVPIDKMGKILTIAMVDPLDTDALAAVRAACPDLRIKPILCDWEHYRSVTRRLFESEGSEPSNTISMASLGLGSAAAKAVKKEEAPKPVEESAPVPAATAPVSPNPAPARSSEAPTVHVTAAPIDTTAITDAIRSGLEQSLGALAAELRRPAESPVAAAAQAPAAAAFDEEKFAAALQQSMRSMFEDVLTRVATANAQGTAVPVAPAPVFDENKLAAVLEQSLRGVLAAQAPAAPDAPAAPPLDPAVIAQAVQQGIREPLETAFGSLVEQLRVSHQSQPVATAPSGPSPQELVEALLTALTPTADAMRQAADSVQQAMAQGGSAAASNQAELSESVTRIMQAAEAAVEATQAAQSLRQSTAEDAEKRHLEKKQRFNTVQPFGTRTEETDPDRIVLSMLDADAPLEGFSFESFCTSKANAFALKICAAIAQNPGGEHNPFFIHGPVGIGKTHIINAVGNAVYSQGDKRVGYVSAGRFAQRLLEARQHHAEDYFREAYSHWDVLILDDIQFLSGHIEAQEEFFHIFNALYGAGRQIILAADQAPGALGGLEARLVSRFDGGLVAELVPPDHSARIAILKHHCKLANKSVSDDALAVIATRISNDVRKMIGALRKVIAFAALVGEDITSEMADSVLGHAGAAQAAR